MTSPIEGEQTRRGQYLGPEHPLVRATSVVAATLAILLVILGLDAALAALLTWTLFGPLGFSGVYARVIGATAFLVVTLLFLETLFPHE